MLHYAKPPACRLEAGNGRRGAAGRGLAPGDATPTPFASRIGCQGGGWCRRYPPPRCNPPHARKLCYSRARILAAWRHVQAVLGVHHARPVLLKKLRHVRRQYPTGLDTPTRRRVADPRARGFGA